VRECGNRVIRDRRSVAASLRIASKSWGPVWGSSRISRICKGWISDVNEGRRISSATHNYQEVTYQDLISDTAEVLLRLFTGLGIRSSLDECRLYVDQCNIEKLRAGEFVNSPFDLSITGKYRFRIWSPDSWRVELSKFEIALVEHLTGPLMSELGFIPTSGHTARSALVALGLQLRRFRNGDAATPAAVRLVGAGPTLQKIMVSFSG
jgi:hypothetical protein